MAGSYTEVSQPNRAKTAGFEVLQREATGGRFPTSALSQIINSQVQSGKEYSILDRKMALEKYKQEQEAATRATELAQERARQEADRLARETEIAQMQSSIDSEKAYNDRQINLEQASIGQDAARLGDEKNIYLQRLAANDLARNEAEEAGKVKAITALGITGAKTFKNQIGNLIDKGIDKAKRFVPETEEAGPTEQGSTITDTNTDINATPVASDVPSSGDIGAVGKDAGAPAKPEGPINQNLENPDVAYTRNAVASYMDKRTDAEKQYDLLKGKGDELNSIAADLTERNSALGSSYSNLNELLGGTIKPLKETQKGYEEKLISYKTGAEEARAKLAEINAKAAEAKSQEEWDGYNAEFKATESAYNDYAKKYEDIDSQYKKITSDLSPKVESYNTGITSNKSLYDKLLSDEKEFGTKRDFLLSEQNKFNTETVPALKNAYDVVDMRMDDLGNYTMAPNEIKSAVDTGDYNSWEGSRDSSPTIGQSTVGGALGLYGVGTGYENIRKGNTIPGAIQTASGVNTLANAAGVNTGAAGGVLGAAGGVVNVVGGVDKMLNADTTQGKAAGAFQTGTGALATTGALQSSGVIAPSTAGTAASAVAVPLAIIGGAEMARGAGGELNKDWEDKSGWGRVFDSPGSLNFGAGSGSDTALGNVHKGMANFERGAMAPIDYVFGDPEAFNRTGERLETAYQMWTHPFSDDPNSTAGNIGTALFSPIAPISVPLNAIENYWDGDKSVTENLTDVYYDSDKSLGENIQQKVEDSFNPFLPGVPIPGCFIKGTKMKLANGKEKAVEKIKIGDNMMEGGQVLGVGCVLSDDVYKYKGIIVTGGHAVLEDGKWIRIESSKLAEKLDGGPIKVYITDNIKHRIIVKDITFADFSECDNSVNMTADQRLEFLNANLAV